MPVINFDDIGADSATTPKSGEAGKGPVKFDDLKPAATPAAPEPVPAQMTKLERFGTGARDFWEGIFQAGAHALPESVVSKEATEKVDERVRRREEDIAKTSGVSPGDTDWWRVAGSLATPVPFVGPGAGAALKAVPKIGKAASSLASGVKNVPLVGKPAVAAAQGALSGAAGGAAEPVTTGKDFASEKLAQAKSGAKAGAVVGTVGDATSRLVAPEFDKAQKALLDAGVKLTGAQMAGSAIKAFEDALGSSPWTAFMVKGAQRGSMESFNGVVINQALSPIGEKLTEGKIGREAIAEAESKISNYYNKLLPNLQFRADKNFAGDVANIRKDFAGQDRGLLGRFDDFVDAHIAPRWQKGGVLDPKDLKTIESQLGQMSRQLYNSEKSEDRFLARQFNDLTAAIRDQLVRNNPGAAADLRNANSAWAMFKRAQDASTRDPKSGGVFSPHQFSSSVQKGNKSKMARGEALMQDISDPAAEVLPSKVPDSGTVGRMSTLGAMGLGGGAAYEYGGHDWESALPAALVSGIFHSPAGVAALNKWATASPQNRGALRKILESIGPGASSAAGSEAAMANRGQK